MHRDVVDVVSAVCSTPLIDEYNSLKNMLDRMQTNERANGVNIESLSYKVGAYRITGENLVDTYRIYIE